MIIESFPTPPSTGTMQSIIPAYVYQQYADDSDLQAFFASYNSLAQGYLDFFNETPLALYTSPAISGLLLDWVGQGIYGIQRPVLATSTITTLGGTNSAATNSMETNGFVTTQSGTASIATDDIYKRCMTWSLYRGDGKQMTMQWLRRRVARFIYGANGSDIDVGLLPKVNLTISSRAVTITVPTAAPGSSALQNLIAQNLLPLPFQLTFSVTLA